MAEEVFSWRRTLELLMDQQVRFVLIGGLAANLHGSPSVTMDLDICYDRTEENVQRLVDVLRSLHAKLRGVEDDVPFQLDVGTILQGDSFTFITDYGAIDILGTPAGTTGYEQLARNAELKGIGVIAIPIASIDDLMRMKRAAGRPKDLIELEVLGALKEEIEARGG